MLHLGVKLNTNWTVIPKQRHYKCSSQQKTHFKPILEYFARQSRQDILQVLFIQCLNSSSFLGLLKPDISSYSDKVCSSPSQEKLALPHSEHFSRDCFPSPSLSPRCCLHQLSPHTLASNISFFILSLASKLSITYLHPIYHFSLGTEVSIPAAASEAFHYYPTIRLFNKHFHTFLSLHPPPPPLPDLTPGM